MAKVIIFGVSNLAEMACYYLLNDSDHEVTAFCVNREFMPESKEYKGFPVVEFEKIETEYSPDEFSFLAPLVPQKMNLKREKIYNEIKSKGYGFISYISSYATVLSKDIGENCFLLEDNTIQPFVKIGNNVVLWSGNHIGHHSIIKDHVFFTSHIVVSGHCEINSYCYLGVNCELRDGITLAEGTFVAMGSSITTSTEPWSVYKGVPATKSNISSKYLRF